MSASSTHTAPRLAATRTASRAWWAERFGTEPEARRQEVGLEDRFEDDLGCRHDHPVTHGGYRQGLDGLPAGSPCLGDVHPPQGLGPVRPGPKLSGELFEEGSHAVHPVGSDVGDGHAVDTGGAWHWWPRRPTPATSHRCGRACRKGHGSDALGPAWRCGRARVGGLGRGPGHWPV